MATEESHPKVTKRIWEAAQCPSSVLGLGVTNRESSFCDVTAYWPLEGPLTKRGCLLEHIIKKGKEKRALGVLLPPRPAQGDGHQKWLQWHPSQWLPTCHRNNTGPIETVFNPSTSHFSQSRSHDLWKGRLELLHGSTKRGYGTTRVAAPNVKRSTTLEGFANMGLTSPVFIVRCKAKQLLFWSGAAKGGLFWC